MADWKYLDDVISALWLGSLAVALLTATGVSAYLIVTGDVSVGGSVDVGNVVNGYLLPIAALLTGMAILDVYGKRRVKTLIDIIRNNDLDERVDDGE